jgi:hypothetical protein
VFDDGDLRVRIVGLQVIIPIDELEVERFTTFKLSVSCSPRGLEASTNLPVKLEACTDPTQRGFNFGRFLQQQQSAGGRRGGGAKDHSESIILESDLHRTGLPATRKWVTGRELELSLAGELPFKVYFALLSLHFQLEVKPKHDSPSLHHDHDATTATSGPEIPI